MIYTCIFCIRSNSPHLHLHRSDLPKLHTLALCVKESMRMYPPVPFIQRTLTEPLHIDGHDIPAGLQVTIPIIHLHRNSLVWEKPDEFKPERFLPENIKDRENFAFIPFSAGSRLGHVIALLYLLKHISNALGLFKYTPFWKSYAIKVFCGEVARSEHYVIFSDF